MAMNELAAIRAADLDIKIVLFQNNTLGLVHQIQKTAPYHGPFGVDLEAPRILRPLPKPIRFPA